MPELCRFYNIVIKMIFSDTDKHHKPHFHVYYNEYEASVGVDGELIAGSLPVKQLKLVQAWAAIHEDELYAAWNKAVQNIPVCGVRPLPGHKLWLRFTTGETKVFDFNPLLKDAGFALLKDEHTFAGVYIDYGVTVWNDGDIDIAPEYLYQHSKAAEGIA